MTGVRRPRDDFRFDARYGRLMRKAGIGTVPFALLFYQGELEITPPEIWLIVFVLAHRWTSDLPYPAIREIERRSGISRKSIFKYKAALEDKGFLEAVHRTRADGGNSSLGWDFSPLFERIDDLITRDVDWWKNRNPQFIEEDVSDRSGRSESLDNPVDNLPPGVNMVAGPGRPVGARAGVDGSPGAGYRSRGGLVTTSTPHVEEEQSNQRKPNLTHIKADDNESQNRLTTQSNSNQRSSIDTRLDGDQNQDVAELPWSPLIDRVIEDYSFRLHDAARNTRANCTRAKRLLGSSNLTEEEFIGIVHEAYHRTQQNSHRIRKYASEAPYGTKNKAPYFFSVLGQLVSGEGCDS